MGSRRTGYLNHSWKNAGHKKAFVDNTFINTDPPHNMWKKKKYIVGKNRINFHNIIAMLH